MDSLERLILPECFGSQYDGHHDLWKHREAGRTKKKLEVVIVNREDDHGDPEGMEEWMEIIYWR